MTNDIYNLNKNILLLMGAFLISILYNCIYMVFPQNGKHQQISGRLQDVRLRKQTQKTELEVLDKQCDLEIMEIKQLQQELQVSAWLLNRPSL